MILPKFDVISPKMFARYARNCLFGCFYLILTVFTNKTSKIYSLAPLALEHFVIWPLPWQLSGYGLACKDSISPTFSEKITADKKFPLLGEERSYASDHYYTTSVSDSPLSRH